VPEFVPDGTITVVGRGLAFDVPDDLRTEVDVDLALGLSADAPTLAGQITVLQGSYREPFSLASQLLSGVESRAVTTTGGWMDELHLSVAVTITRGFSEA
jgi:hypothetical protein